jgi:predicted dithiol-disulfide oxidoreductase (DUF899 family)
VPIAKDLITCAPNPASNPGKICSTMPWNIGKEDGGSMHKNRFPGESSDYRAARDSLLRAELELRRQTEEVAAMRRALPPGGSVSTRYTFEGGDGPSPLSRLFGKHSTLVLYNFMYGPAQEQPCPMCTSFIDGLAGNAIHIEQRAALAIVAKSAYPRIMTFAATRAWSALRLYSSANTTFNRDYFGEDEGGAQDPMLHVFVRNGEDIVHTWSSELQMVASEPGQNQRHLDSMWPLWNVLDCTPQGRGADFYPRLRYDG